MAAVKIQLVVRSFLQRRRAKRWNQAAVTIQTVWRGYAARNRLRLKKEAQLRAQQHEAATVIQVGVYTYAELKVSHNRSNSRHKSLQLLTS